MVRQKIGVDVDDVLSRSAEGFADFSTKRWGKAHRAEDYTEDWAAFWGAPLEEALQRVKEVHTSGVFGKFLHFEAALPALRELAQRYELIVITSRREQLKPETDAWIARHFPDVFSGVHYAGIWDREADPHHLLKQTKASICRELGVQYLIDDQPKHCIAAAESGINALLFGDYAWNRSGELPARVTRVKDWQSVVHYFNEQS